jgi:pimeloyl-ACP methyl ester carboxylesterase
MATPTLTSHTLPGALGPILVDVLTGDREVSRPAVLVVHGFKGFKDWGMFPAVALRLARAGFTAVSFNLSGSGVDEHGDFVYPERFGHNTFSAEQHDVQVVLAALARGDLGLAAATEFGLLGHSRGGGTAILAAAADPRVRALVTWASIAEVHRWPGRAAAWRQAGKLEIVNARTGQVLPLYPDVLDDVERNQAALDIPAAAERIRIPWLIIHGTADESVSVEEARLLARHAPEARLLLLEGAGHTFGAVHPFAGMTPDLAQALDETVKWMGRHL